MNKRLALLACLFLALQLGACTSKDSRDDEAAAEESVSSEESLEDVEGFESAESTEGVEGEGELADAGDGESFTEEALPDTPPEGDALAETDGDMDLAGVDEGGTVADTPAEAPADSSLPPAEPGFTDSSSPSDSAFTDNSMPPPADDMAQSEPPPPPPADIAPPMASSSSSSEGRSYPVIPLKKMEATPFEREGAIMNTVYYARPGDSFSKVAKMIYGDGKRSRDLRSWNPDTMPRVGDPIYYNSPNRPGDAAVMKVYYDDVGQQPQTHIAAEGDDLKRVSQDALGFEGAWKEVWATNSQDSKGKLAAGTELRLYGASGEVAPSVPVSTPPLAENTAPPMPEMPAEPDLGAMPPMDSPDMANLPPPPDAGMMPPDAGMPPQEPDMGMPPMDASAGDAMAGMNAPPPEMAPPPPPPPPPAPEETPQMAKKPDLAGDSADNDIMMALIAGGAMAALLAGFMVARRRRQQREMAAAFGDTQVGT